MDEFRTLLAKLDQASNLLRENLEDNDTHPHLLDLLNELEFNITTIQEEKGYI